MRVILSILLLTVSIILAKDTSDVYLRDTIITKSVNNTSFWDVAFLQTFVSVLAGSLVSLIVVKLSNKQQKKLTDIQIENQRKLTDKQIHNQLIVAQSNIDVTIKHKYIDDLIEQSKIISQHVFTVFQLAKDLHDNVISYRNIGKTEIKSSIDRDIFKEFLSLNRTLLEKLVIISDEISKENRQLNYSVGSLFLYIKQDDDNIEELKTLATNLQVSYSDYAKYILIEGGNIDTIKVENDERSKLARVLDSDHELLIKKIHNIIDDERDILDSIILVRPKNTPKSDPDEQHIKL